MVSSKARKVTFMSSQRWCHRVLGWAIHLKHIFFHWIISPNRVKKIKTCFKPPASWWPAWNAIEMMLCSTIEILSGAGPHVWIITSTINPKISYKQIILPAPKKNIKHQHHLQPACWCLIFDRISISNPQQKDAKKIPISPSSPNRPHKHPNKWSTACGAAATSKHQDLRNFFSSNFFISGGATNPRQKLNMELGHHVPPSVDGNLQGAVSSFISSISNVYLVILMHFFL